MSSFSSYLPPPTPPPSPPPPPPNHRSTEGETQRLTTTWLSPPPPSPPLPPPTERAQGTPGERGGGPLTQAGLLSVARVPSPALWALAGGGSARAHAPRAVARRTAPPAWAPPPSPWGPRRGLGLCGSRVPPAPDRGARRERARRERAWADGAGVEFPDAAFCRLPAWGLNFPNGSRTASCPVAHCSPPAACAGAGAPRPSVVLAFRFRGGDTRRSWTLIQAFSFHPLHRRRRCIRGKDVSGLALLAAAEPALSKLWTPSAWPG